jgi:hypothetical protein
VVVKVELEVMEEMEDLVVVLVQLQLPLIQEDLEILHQ